MRNIISELPDKIGEEVELKGWVHIRRDHGKLIFIDLRDRSGIVQLVFVPQKGENGGVHAKAEELRSEWVISVKGTVSERPASMVNSDIPTGGIEVQVSEIEILNESETPPFPIDADGKDINEESRMQYRYLDLRRERMANNIRKRYAVTKYIRDFLGARDFIEIETPILTKSTPEGARDYLVPSRLYNGKFYALPQAPQQYKQLLMVAGIERYFQIARCFRDEDTRGDRQPEFTQLDLEMSFVDREDVMSLTEELIIDIVGKLYPEKRIQERPFPRIAYKEAMEKYGTDRPDIRENKEDSNLLAFCWVVDFPFFEKTDEGKWTFTHNPFSSPRKDFMDDLMQKRNIENIITDQYDIVLNGYEVGGGSIRNHKPEALKKVLEIMDYSEEKIQENFGHILEAFKFGAPPHGGIAPGLDRLVMILQNEPNIREVIGFPKTGDGRDLMMNAPAEVGPKQLNELGIEIKKEKNKKF
ncbi:MAG: aspartate--tRNA ligase [Candidatus Colwellbacteria bacterium]|jgi:aspartyl-tRNA synthetase|nr:aspartate--tRNA ligase [Candidatus Colwellbacteria bacterium]MCK9497432.1 aspartate--tRNA ligase [Candidatus Colwellbacteria bacterium]MDD3752510.1 aspartate--tRNA ligase [Candidatus Colwellbacteria bacterium]MDD4818854.1 aspartate--tRNA ligase [Candidatus Colwellbacteria bacterium]